MIEFWTIPASEIVARATNNANAKTQPNISPILNWRWNTCMMMMMKNCLSSLNPLRNLLYSIVDFPVIVSLLRNSHRTSTFASFHSLKRYEEIDLENDLALYDELVSFNDFVHRRPLPSIKDFCKLLTRILKMHHYSVVISLVQRLDMLGVKSDIYAFNIAINCFCHLNRVDFALSMFGKSLKRGYKPDSATFNTLIRGLCANDSLNQAVQLFDQMLESSLKPNIITYGTLINGMCKMGNTNDAIILLRKLEEQSKSIHSPRIRMAVEYLEILRKNGFSLDAYTESLLRNFRLCVQVEDPSKSVVERK
ncbi:hypothetical protein L2E82_21619 [Cichorium intybus]|uniref:Uncharacterized protein n=1 Tax=Cichorium intybus TaxID=13427 RepID=A0ACB9DWE4_CICIN|nr:hypothetical protein L2E82_21619 [Cichorium intybus]